MQDHYEAGTMASKMRQRFREELMTKLNSNDKSALIIQLHTNWIYLPYMIWNKMFCLNFAYWGYFITLKRFTTYIVRYLSLISPLMKYRRFSQSNIEVMYVLIKYFFNLLVHLWRYIYMYVIVFKMLVTKIQNITT